MIEHTKKTLHPLWLCLAAGILNTPGSIRAWTGGLLPRRFASRTRSVMFGSPVRIDFHEKGEKQ
jgi:hypothetical protein